MIIKSLFPRNPTFLQSCKTVHKEDIVSVGFMTPTFDFQIVV